MLCFNVFWILVLAAWGLIGIHTDKFGFKHVWEIWCDGFCYTCDIPLGATLTDCPTVRNVYGATTNSQLNRNDTTMTLSPGTARSWCRTMLDRAKRNV